MPPPASSPKTTVLPSHENVAEWKNSTFALWTRAIVRGCALSEMSQIWPSPMQADAARLIAMYTEMSWQPFQPSRYGFCGNRGSLTTLALVRIVQRHLDDRDLVVPLAILVDAQAGIAVRGLGQL